MLMWYVLAYRGDVNVAHISMKCSLRTLKHKARCFEADARLHHMFTLVLTHTLYVNPRNLAYRITVSAQQHQSTVAELEHRIEIQNHVPHPVGGICACIYLKLFETMLHMHTLKLDSTTYSFGHHKREHMTTPYRLAAPFNYPCTQLTTVQARPYE